MLLNVRNAYSRSIFYKGPRHPCKAAIVRAPCRCVKRVAARSAAASTAVAMAFSLDQAPRAIADGQITQTVYGYIRDHKWHDALDVLQQQLVVRRRPRIVL